MFNLPGHSIPLLAAFTVAIMWGMAGVFIRLLPATSALSITAGRLLIALLATLPIFLLSVKIELISKAPPAIVTAAVLLLIPVFAGIFAYFLLAETLTPFIIPGGLLVLLGIAMILNHNRIKT